MNLRSVDLNLLVILDALLEERHVTRAAMRLSLSQPATSSALERCRFLFSDPLLIRSRGEMRLSAKAETLKGPIRSLLMQAESVLEQSETSLHDIKKTIRIIMADLPVTAILGPLHQRLIKTAPNLNLIIQPWHGSASALDGLARGEADLAVSVFPNVGNSFRCVELLNEEYYVLMRKSHPAVAQFDLSQWLSYPHIMVSGQGESYSAIDQVLLKQGLSRRIGLVVPYFQMVPDLVAKSDYIALLPSRCLPKNATNDFVIFPPPVAVSGFSLHLAWHLRSDTDSAVNHVSDVIRELTSSSSALLE